MLRINHKLKLIVSKVKWCFNTLVWARKHAKEVDNYKFLVKLRKLAHDRMLEAERKENKETTQKLEIQVNLIDKILKYTNGR
jgi:hypothetical protein